MSPVRVTFRRTVGMARSLYTTAIAYGLFLSGAAILFAFNLEAAEGGMSRLSSVWAVSVSPFLPALAALFGMDVWSDERRTGRMDILLSAPVRERDYVIGKFLGVWSMTMVAIALSLVGALVSLRFAVPALCESTALSGFLPAFIALGLQSALWCAVSVASSALFANSAASAAATLAVLVAFPRGLWFALANWSPIGRSRFGEFPVDEHAFDMASGLVSTGTVISYVLFTAAALFMATKTIALVRCVGRGAAGLRFTTRLSILLAMVFSALASALAMRLDETLDLPVGGVDATRFSQRTRSILSSSRGAVTVTAFMSRKDSSFRQLAHFLRAVRRESNELGGIRIEIRYVDPALDLGEAQRLVRAGVQSGSLVFERAGRIIEKLPVEGGCGERMFASVIERIATPFHRSSVYWTRGHGEVSFEDYSSEGMSDIARELSLDGYANRFVDLTDGGTIAEDCAMIVVAGARTDFSSGEADRLRAYLEGRNGHKGGGRLLVLEDSSEARAVTAILSEWGIRVSGPPTGPTRTISGTDVIASEFGAEHPVSKPFDGQQVVFLKPVSLAPSAAVAEAGTGADRKVYAELVRAGGSCLAAAVERGDASADLDIRPTRVVAVGDVGFAKNGALRTYANANGDFFLNVVKYLSGRDVLTEVGADAGRLVSGMDRATRSRFAVNSALVLPGVVFLVFVAATFRRRRRQ